MLRKEEVRLIVNLDDLRDYNREYADGWVLRVPGISQSCSAADELVCPPSSQPSASADLFLARL
jgi:hypothetical protein